MADLLPSSPDTSAAEDADPRVVGVDSDDADDLIGALSSGTSRALLAALHDEPANPAKLADAVDTTIQNAQYHLEKLEDASLIEVVDTVYSEKGREMNVYAPSDRPLVVVAGREEEASGLQAALSRLLGALGALALGSALVQQLLSGDLLSVGGAEGGDSASRGGATGTEAGYEVGANATGTDGGATATSTPAADSTPAQTAEAEATPTPTVEAEATPTPAMDTADATSTPQSTGTPTPTPGELAEQTAEISDLAASAGPDVAPGLLFFAGGAVVLVAGFAYWYARQRP